MPKKMNKVEESWEDLIKYLPKNWCQHISDKLNKRGISITARSVSDVKGGRIKNILIRKEVWREIRKQSNSYKKAMKSIPQ